MNADSTGTTPILDAALAQFVLRGYEGASLDAIGTAAGLDRPAVELLFPTKAALFQALLDREVARAEADVVDSVPTGAGGDTVGRAVARSLDRLLVRARANPRAWRLLLLSDFGSFGESDARDRVRSLLRTRLRWLLASTAPLRASDRRVVSELVAAMVAALFETQLDALLAGSPAPDPLGLEEGLSRLFASG